MPLTQKDRRWLKHIKVRFDDVAPMPLEGQLAIAEAERDAALEQLATTGQINERLAWLVRLWRVVALQAAVVAVAVCGWALWGWWR